jgi:hypothetical protein
LPFLSALRPRWSNLGLPRSIAVIVLLSLLTRIPVQLCTLVTGAEAAGNTYYVAPAPSGNDLNNGTKDHPWATIRKAAISIASGDTVYIRDGQYNVGKHDGPINPPSGTTFMAYLGEKPIIQGSYPSTGEYPWEGISIQGASNVRIEGLTIRGFHTGIACGTRGHHIVLKNNTLEYNSETGISSESATSGSQQSCDYLTIVGNQVHHNGYRYDTGRPATGPGEGWSSGISIHPRFRPYLLDGDASKFHIIISGNRVYHNYDGTGGDTDNAADHSEGHGIILDSGGSQMPPTLIENNVVFDNGGKCICALGTQNFWIVGNTCYANSTDPLLVAGFSKAEIAAYETDEVPATNIHVLNNIAWALPGQKIADFPDSDSQDLDMRNNLWYGSPPNAPYSCPYGLNAIFANPLFIDPTANPPNFELQARSPAIDAGAAIGAEVIPLRTGSTTGSTVVDFDGTERPHGRGYDMGAYESLLTRPLFTPTSFVWLPFVMHSTSAGACP